MASPDFSWANFFRAPNPKVGAVFTYYLKDDIKSLKEKRRDEEKEKQKKKENIKYPAYQTLLNEKENLELIFYLQLQMNRVM